MKHVMHILYGLCQAVVCESSCGSIEAADALESSCLLGSSYLLGSCYLLPKQPKSDLAQSVCNTGSALQGKNKLNFGMVHTMMLFT